MGAEKRSKSSEDSQVNMSSDEERLTVIFGHMRYEIYMFTFCHDQILHLMQFTDTPNNEQIDTVLVFWESFLMHARCIHEFFYKKKDKRYEKTDARSTDFLSDISWRPEDPFGQDTKDKIDTGIAHISYKRGNNKTRPLPKPEDVESLYKKLMTVFDAFCKEKPEFSNSKYPPFYGLWIE